MCDFYELSVSVSIQKEELGQMIGREYRACLAINDSGFAQSIKQQLQLMAQESNGGIIMAKIRIHEIAKELNVQAKDVMGFLETNKLKRKAI